MSRIIAINGTPGSGKSTVASYINTGRKIINLEQFAQKIGCIVGKDESKDCVIIDENCLNMKVNLFLAENSENIIFEGHLTDLIPKRFLLHCFVLEVKINDLRVRLRQREYSLKKIEENVLAELMKDCYIRSLNAFGKEKVTLVPAGSLKDTVVTIQKKLTSLM